MNAAKCNTLWTPEYFIQGNNFLNFFRLNQCWLKLLRACSHSSGDIRFFSEYNSYQFMFVGLVI